jgi:hypothetical protein
MNYGKGRCCRDSIPHRHSTVYHNRALYCGDTLYTGACSWVVGYVSALGEVTFRSENYITLTTSEMERMGFTWVSK